MKIKAKEIILPTEEPPADIFDEDTEEHVEKAAPPAPKQHKTTNVVLVILALFLVVFIVAMIVIFCVKGSVPDTLIQYVLGAGGVEAVLLAGIKISKVLAGDRHDSDPSDGVG